MAQLVNQTLVESKIYFRYRVLVFWSFVFPLLFLAVFSPERASLDFSFPGIVVMSLLTTCVSNTVAMIVGERRSDLYKRLSLTPLKRSTLIFAKLISRYMVVVIQMVLLFGVAGLAFGIWPQGNLLELAVLLSLGALCFLSMALFVAGVVHDENAANIITMIVFFTLAFGSNTFFSISLYPEQLQPVIGILPTTHLATTLRAMLAGQSSLQATMPAFIWIGAYWAIFSVLSIKFFKWDSS